MGITCFIEATGPLWKVSPLKHNLRQWRLFLIALKEPSKKVSPGLSLSFIHFYVLPDCEQDFKFWVFKLFLAYLTWEWQHLSHKLKATLFLVSAPVTTVNSRLSERLFLQRPE